MTHLLTMIGRLVRNEEGEDLVEYAYLTLFIAIAGAATLTALQAAIGAAYGTSAGAVDGLWQPPNPAGS
jgi:Flp pilus assembly pilin Flp